MNSFKTQKIKFLLKPIYDYWLIYDYVFYIGRNNFKANCLIFNIKNLNVSLKERKRRKNILNANNKISIHLK